MKVSGHRTAQLSACLLTIAVLAAVGAAAEETGDKTVTKVTAKDVSKYTAAQLNADMGLGLTAGAGFDAAQAKSAAERGFGTVKIECDWSGQVSADGSYTLDELCRQISHQLQADFPKDRYQVFHQD